VHRCGVASLVTSPARRPQNESAGDEHGVAYALLSLATVYNRRLATGVMQFAYSCVQEHAVWRNQAFWQAAFFHDVHCELRAVYAPRSAPSAPSDGWGLAEQPSLLRVIAELQTKTKAAACWLPQAQLDELRLQEEAIVYSQAIHYANRVVYFLVPLDFNRLRRVNVRSLEARSASNVSSSNHR